VARLNETRNASRSMVMKPERKRPLGRTKGRWQNNITAYNGASPVWWPGVKNSPNVTHACRKRRLKWGPPGWGLGVGFNPTPEKNYCHETFR